MNIIIIPSYNPSEKLIQIVKELKQKGFDKIIIVDDGSQSRDIFNKLQKEAIIVHHNHNMGKGAAIKTGVRKAIKLFPNLDGYVFMDSDGQHLIKDVKNVSDEMLKTRKIIFGVRNFTEESVPKRSKFGNNFSSIYFKLVTGKKLSDTQTGLRAIPKEDTNYLLMTKGDRYEYEMNFLMNMAKDGLPYEERQITTVYENGNHESHFHPIKDSLRIYREAIKFIFISITSFIIDICLFAAFNKLFKDLFIASIMARIMSGLYNYNLNKYWCFKSYGKHEFSNYLLLFIIQMLISSGLVKLFSLINNHFIIIKILIDFALFLCSFVIQKRYIFKGGDNENIQAF